LILRIVICVLRAVVVVMLLTIRVAAPICGDAEEVGLTDSGVIDWVFKLWGLGSRHSIIDLK
jgi:hypothetical protein